MNFAEHPVGSVCWLDLGVADADSAASFYSQLFGWTIAGPDEAGYRLAVLDGQPVAGLGPADDPGPPYWTVYLHTADIDASTKAASAAGGTIIVPPAPAGDAGVAAVVRHPGCGPLSFWQPGDLSGTWASGQHGTLAGVQLRVRDPDTARAFLRATAGWDPRPDGTIARDERTVATWAPGAVTGRPDEPSPWLVSFLVASVSTTAERALQLGAKTVSEQPAILLDPSGAILGLTQITGAAV